MSLAHAYLSLTDDGAEPAVRSPRLAVAAVVTALALAFSIPLGWLAGQPIAAVGSKVALLDDEAGEASPCGLVSLGAIALGAILPGIGIWA